MNKNHAGDNADIPINEHNAPSTADVTDDLLEQHISRSLHNKVDHLLFSPALQMRVLQELPTRRMLQRRRRLTASFRVALATLLLLAVGLLTNSARPLPHTPVKPALTIQVFENGQILDTPAALSQGAQLLSIDPTGHNLAYTPANQPDTMYTTSIDDPLDANVLAMRDTRGIAWSPQGDKLAITVQPTGTFEPLLALVPLGKYMHLLGHDALAATWLPNSGQEITFVTQASGKTQLWQTSSSGQSLLLLATMPLPFIVRELAWSPDGHWLAIEVNQSTSITGSSLSQPGRTIYLMDAQTKGLREVVAAGNFSVKSMSWSPDGRYLTYERSASSGQQALCAIAISNLQKSFTLPIKQHLIGWSWSPDSRVLVYSDGGVLRPHTLYGADLQFPASSAIQANPHWLPNGQLLYLNSHNGVSKLAMLIPQSH